MLISFTTDEIVYMYMYTCIWIGEDENVLICLICCLVGAPT